MGLLRRKWLRRTVLILACFAVVGLLTLVAVCIHIHYTAKPHLKTAETAEDADCILVLGCGVREDGSPSLMLRDRLDMGIRLYEQGAAGKLLMSGDHGRVGYDEVNTMKDYAIAAGVPSEDIFMDHAGFSTYESMYRAGEVFMAKRVIIVSQAYHLPRAVYDARALGLDAQGVAAAQIPYFGRIGRSVREYLAQAKDFLYCLVKPMPTFLGEPIPVWGNGDLTND